MIKLEPAGTVKKARNEYNEPTATVQLVLPKSKKDMLDKLSYLTGVSVSKILCDNIDFIALLRRTIEQEQYEHLYIVEGIPDVR